MSEHDQDDSQDNDELNNDDVAIDEVEHAAGDGQDSEVASEASAPDDGDLDIDIDDPLDTGTQADDRPPVEEPRELSDADRAKLADLDEALEKYEAQKRWSDVIRTIRSKADIVVDPQEKAELFRQAGQMYLTKSSNQAEAIKCYEALIAISPEDADALSQLRDMYEKRRDWAKLIDTMRHQAEMLPIDEQASAFEEMAQIASKRLRKPEACIDLWARVIEADPGHAEALDNLAKLYERAKQWEPLAEVLTKLSDQTDDEKTLKVHLQKLGTVLAEKVGDDEGAVEAFRRLLDMDPSDRRAQEQLKRRFIALKSWDELEDFYAANEKWDELIRVLEREADSDDTDTEDKVALLFRAANLWAEKKERPDRAARALEKVLANQADNLEAAEALTPIYEEANDPKKLVKVYEVQLQHAEDADTKLDFLQKAAALYEERLRDPQSAFDHYIAAFRADPMAGVVREELDRLAEATGAWPAVNEAYESVIDQAGAGDDSLSLRVLYGKTLMKVERLEEAIRQFETVRGMQDDHPAAIEALIDLYRTAQRYDELLSLIDERLELEMDGERRRDLGYAKASLIKDQLGDVQGAIQAFESVLDEHGVLTAAAFRDLSELYAQESRWGDQIRLMERRLDSGPDSDEELVELKFRLGNALSDHNEDYVAALDHYRDVLILGPEHEGCRERLEGLLSEEGVKGQAAALLEPVYEVQGDAAKQVRVLEVMRDSEPDPQQRLQLSSKAADVYSGELEDMEGCFRALAEGLRAVPDDAGTLGRLEDLSEQQDSFGALVALLNEVGESTTDPSLSRSLFIRASAFADERENDLSSAAQTLSRVLEQDPDDVEVLVALESLYRRSERWAEVVSVLRRRADLESDLELRENLLSQAATIQEELLEDPEGAIGLHREILEINPASFGTLSALNTLLQSLNQWSDLADNLERQLEVSFEVDDQVSVLLRLADLRREKLGSVEAAIDTYRDVLERDEGNEAAIGALEALLDDEAHQLTAAEILEPLYRSSGRMDALIGVHEVQCRHASSPERRVELLHRIAEIYEDGLSQPEQAFQSLSRALAEDAGNTNTQEQMERVAAGAGAWDDLAKAYEDLVDDLEDDLLAIGLLTRAAQIREENLDDAERAIAHYRAILGRDPEHLETTAALERVFQVAERYQDLAEICVMRAGLLMDATEQKEYLFRAAAIYEELLERPESGLDIYKQVLEIDGENVEAMDKLIELYLRAERWQELLAVYRRKADVVLDPEERKRIFVEAGTVYERELNDVPNAIDTYNRMLEIDPDDSVALERLDSLYQQSEEWEELLSVLERRADLGQEPMEVLSLRHRVGEVWQRHLSDAQRAIDVYRDILEVASDHEPTLNALESMISSGQEVVAAANALEPIYELEGEWAKLARVLEVLSDHNSDPLGKVEYLHKIAQIYEARLGQVPEAFDAYGRALPHDNLNDLTCGALERLAEELERWEQLSSLYDAELNRLAEESSGDTVDFGLRVGTIYEVQVGDVDRAIERYELVHRFDDRNAQGLDSLDRLYEATQRWEKLAGILSEEAACASSPDDILEFQYRLGQVYQHRLGRLTEAVQCYREILAAAPEHEGALAALETLFGKGHDTAEIGEVLESIYRMREAWSSLMGVLAVQISHQDDVREQVSIMQRIGEIAEERAYDSEEAFTWMQRAVMADPSHEYVVSEAERLAEQLDGWPILAGTYAEVLTGGAAAPARLEIGHRLAQAYELKLDDLKRAEQTYRFLLSVDHNDAVSLEALDRIYTADAAYQALADVLGRRAKAADHPDDRVAHYYRLGMTMQRDLGREVDALQNFNYVLTELDPQHIDSIHAVQGIYTDRQDWQNLFLAYDQELDAVMGDTQRSEVLARMARIASEKLQDNQRAVGLWDKVLDLRGEDPEALNALGDIHCVSGNWRELVDVLEREVNVVDDDVIRMKIFGDLATTWSERLERPRNALDYWERVLDVEPGNTGALFRMANIHRGQEDWTDLIDTLRRISDVGSAVLEDDTLERVHLDIGDVYERRLAQPLDAVEDYHSVLETNPSNQAAMAALERIHRTEEQWEDVCQVLEQRYRATEADDDRVAILLEIASIWAQHVEAPDRGTSALSRVIEIDPMHQHAFDQLDIHHREHVRWEELIDVYLSRAEATEDDLERVRLLREISRMYEEDLQDLEKAFDALTFAWSQDFADMETAKALERVCGLTNQWNELLQVANEALAAAQEEEDVERQIAICLNAARWYGQELEHAEYAIPYYQQILSLDPGNVPALLQMADLYRDTQQWSTMADVLHQLLDAASEPEVLGNVNYQLGEISERHLGEPEKAIQYYETAFELDLSNVEALKALERRYEERGDWSRLIEVLTRKARELSGLEGEVQAKMQLARALEEHAGQPNEAIVQLEGVLQIDDRHVAAIRSLDRLYTATSKWTELRTNLELQVDLAETERERVDLHTRLAHLLEVQFLKPDDAASQLEMAMEIDPLNAPALEGLTRLYRQLQRWDDLVQALERRIGASADREVRIASYKDLADVYAGELGQIDMGIDAYQNVLAVDEEDYDALKGLAKLYSKQGDHARAVEMMEQLAQRAPDVETRVELLYQAARILDTELGDRYMAQERYQSVLDSEPNHIESLQGLRAIYVDGGDFVAAARVLEVEAAAQTNARLAARAFVELGRIYGERLDDAALALSAFERALQHDADNLDAMLPLAEEYVRQGRHEEAVPYLQNVTQRGGAKEPAEQLRLNVTLGESASHLGNYPDAIKAFARAHSMDPNNLPALFGLAGSHFAAEDWAQAFKYYQMILVHHRDHLDRSQSTEVFYRLGVIKTHQGDRRKALNFFDKALEEDGIHRASIEATIAIYEEQSQWEQVIHFTRRLMDVADHDDERVSILERIGDLWADQAKNQEKAIEAFMDGVAVQPDNHRLMHKLLMAYQTTRQWDRAIDIIERISEQDGRAEAQAKYSYTIGVILRDELKDPDAAVTRFEEALDLDPGRLKAFEAVNKLLTQTKDWKRLERTFRKMLHRIVGQGQTDLEFSLWHSLGVIYRDRQKNYEAAADAFKMASDLQPENAAERIILSELYSQLPERVSEAIDAHQWLLGNDPGRVDSYNALYRLYFDAHAYDKAWCVAGTLAHLGKADQEQEGFYDQYKRSGGIRPTSRLGNDSWVKDLYHPDQNPYVSKIMEILASAVLGLKASSDKALNLSPKYLEDTQTSEATFSKTFGFAAQVLNIPVQPRLFLQKDQSGGLMHVPGSSPPAMVAGNSLLSGYQPQDLAFILGRYLAYYRPEHFIRTMMTSHNELKTILLAGIRLGGVGGDDPAIVETAQTLMTKLTPAAVDALKQTMQRFSKSGAQADMKQWMQAVELTALRAGYVLCGDLGVAKRTLGQLPAEMTHDMTPDEKFRELVLFSVSPQYFRIREALGITIQV